MNKLKYSNKCFFNFKMLRPFKNYVEEEEEVM